ncbi:multidrug resistance efflux transporter family protein [Bacillus sp. EB600]|uniref:multidrug resistance efflux transporter family protein n=1 Tax=Bacillus sp. EB600 TaxID=2806345 RepID=UPI0035BFC4DF
MLLSYFFRATDRVRGNMQGLASVEATQSMEVLFALGRELLYLSIHMPSPLSLCGIFIVILGLILHSFVSKRKVESYFEHTVEQ